uniref:Uncharacterized protein n=1 Tax=Bacillus thuringiensis TaxID=1428 RepID=C9K1L6_BACTU|nr:hypothetical protein [Bacillus thuringiensis]
MTHFSDNPLECSKEETDFCYSHSELPQQELPSSQLDFHQHHPYNHENPSACGSNKQIETQKKKYTAEFKTMFQIPKEYQLVTPKIDNFFYNVNNVSIVQEIGKKTVIVDECGHTDLNLYMLKAKGNISFISNISIKSKPKYESKIGSMHCTTNNILLSIEENIPVDIIFKYSLTPLAYHTVDTNHVKLKHIGLVPFSSSDPNLYSIQGEFQFFYE